MMSLLFSSRQHLSRSTASITNSCTKRSFAVPTSAVDYKRKGDQPQSAPIAAKKISKVSNIKVATLDGRGPVSSLAIVLGAGSRHELPSAPGVAHFLKNTLIRTVPGDNILRTIREVELRGDSLYTALTREQLVIGSSFLRDDLVDAVPLLVNQLFNPSFQPYEFLDAVPGILNESAVSLANPETKVLDALHAVAFRNGLGNSLFATAAGVKALKRADLQSFASTHFTADRIAVVGTGIAHDELSALVEESIASVKLSTAAAAGSSPAQYYGGETRIDAGPKAQAHFTVAYKAPGFTSQDHAASQVLRALLGGSPRVKWGAANGVTSALSAAGTPSTTVSALGASYTDAGLVGFYVTGAAGEVKSVAKKAIEAIQNVARGTGSVTAEALQRAKKRAVVDAEASAFGSVDAAVLEVGKQVIATGAYGSIADVAAAIEKVTAEDVVKVAKAAVSSKPSVVAYGNLHVLPYADEL